MTSASVRTSSGDPCLMSRPRSSVVTRPQIAEYEVRVVLDKENADAAVADHLDDASEVIDFGAGQAAGRFVEKEISRPQRQGARDLEEALLCVLEQVRPAVRERGRDRLRGSAPRRGSEGARSSPSVRGSAKAVVRKPDATSRHAPSMALSRTVNVPRRRGFWKVRAMPSLARCCTE